MSISPEYSRDFRRQGDAAAVRWLVMQGTPRTPSPLIERPFPAIPGHEADRPLRRAFWRGVSDVAVSAIYGALAARIFDGQVTAGPALRPQTTNKNGTNKIAAVLTTYADLATGAA